MESDLSDDDFVIISPIDLNVLEKMQKLETELLAIKMEANLHFEGNKMGLELENQFAGFKKKIDILEKENNKLEEELTKKSLAIIELKERNAQFISQNDPINENIIANINGEFISFKKNAASDGQQNILIKDCQYYVSDIHANDGKFMQLADFKNNKWNLSNCSIELSISFDGLGIEKTGSSPRCDSVRGNIPIQLHGNTNHAKKPYIAGYFEVKIMRKPRIYICIGFCAEEFFLEGDFVGQRKNHSIGFWRKNEIYIDGIHSKFKNSNPVPDPIRIDDGIGLDDVIGIGLVYSPEISKIEWFASLNGKLLGKDELPTKFITRPLFPVVSMTEINDAIIANFGNTDFLYDPNQIL